MQDSTVLSKYLIGEYRFRRVRNDCLFLCLFLQNYLVITECDHCGFSTTRTITTQPTLDVTLPCGNTYTFIVKVQTKHGTSGDSKIQFELKPSVGAVTNLMVNFIGGGEDTNGTDWSKEFEKGFLLTWNAPRDINASDIQVRD